MDSKSERAPFSFFVDRLRKPSDASIRKVLLRASGAWNYLLKLMLESYGLKGSMHFMYGQRYGWALRFQQGSRFLLALYPNQNCLTVQIVLGPAQVIAASTMGLPPRVLAVLEAAKKYPEGRWLFIPVKSIANARQLRSLIALKISHHRFNRDMSDTR